MKDNKRNKEVIRFLKWIRRYNGWWYLICNPGDEHMNPDMMKLLITKLAKESFYEMIVVCTKWRLLELKYPNTKKTYRI